MCWGPASSSWNSWPRCAGTSQSLTLNRPQADHTAFLREALKSRRAWPPLVGSRSACGHKKAKHLLEKEGSDVTSHRTCASSWAVQLEINISQRKPNSVQDPLYPESKEGFHLYIFSLIHPELEDPHSTTPFPLHGHSPPDWPSALPVCPSPASSVAV